jgi:succinate dehydrogenase / fumarate reductase, cytochrome b subunit
LHGAINALRENQVFGVFNQGAEPMAQNRARPLSPHLLDYKWGIHMIASIINRITGIGLATFGAVVLVWWLYALASGPAAYNNFAFYAGSWFGRIVLIGLTWAFLQHLCGGIRHFILDMGAGYELKTNRIGSIMTFVVSILGTVAIWAYLFFGKGI